ncbi:thiamine phosphate synthase [Polaribacter sargassicola]|uniref:thiamine phosphate synthase n=1 Tax=Polaribacter sargassicola TaxID=2836891 RepID=UPI001F028EA4|nr:thiamine phosphate synthase [Polaribacter sp. DS7-9]MCG1036747.1 thiamine phosphate synthase [Polaribacter sp. DS7-9]
MINKLHYISQGATPQEHLNNIQNTCSSGIELVQLRLKNVDENTVLETAKKAKEITDNFQTKLIINDYYKVAASVKADGVHLGKTDACPTEVRKELKSWQIIGGTANTLEDCKNLIEKKVDYIGLGPFQFTKTKKNLSPILGLDGYRKLLEELQTNTPIIAIGGITLNDVSAILETGIYGIAVSSEITKNYHKISEFHKLLHANRLQEQVFRF